MTQWQEKKAINDSGHLELSGDFLNPLSMEARDVFKITYNKEAKKVMLEATEYWAASIQREPWNIILDKLGNSIPQPKQPDKFSPRSFYYRSIDDLGRIIVPASMRALLWQEGQPTEMLVNLCYNVEKKQVTLEPVTESNQ